MRPWMLVLALLIVAAAAAVHLIDPAASGAEAAEPDAAYVTLDADLEPFRSQFDAAADHVRAVLLVGPT